jgi:hypothetical protein
MRYASIRTISWRGIVRFRDIYKAATSVVSWLGEDAEHTEPLLRYLRRNGRVSRTLFQYDGDWVEHTPRLEIEPEAAFARTDALRLLLRKTYWSRAWILQELIHGREITLMCGDEHISWAYLIALRNHSLWSKAFDNTIFGKLVDDKTALCSGYHLTLHILMDEYPNRRCSDPRDQIYSLLSIDSTYKPPKRLIDVDYAIDCQSLLFRTFNASHGGRNPATFERLRLALGIPWADILDDSKTRYATANEEYFEPQFPWAIYSQLSLQGRVSYARTTNMDGHDFIAVSMVVELRNERINADIQTYSIATVAEVGDYVVGFEGSSLALVLRIVDGCREIAGKAVHGHHSVATALSEAEWQALTCGSFSFKDIGITTWSEHAIARLDAKQWHAVCSCSKARNDYGEDDGDDYST